jgi:hypothetical protein
MKFRSQIENKVSDYRVLRASSFLSDQRHSQEIEKEKVQELTDICSESNRNTAETATTIDLADVDHNPNDLSGAEIDHLEGNRSGVISLFGETCAVIFGDSVCVLVISVLVVVLVFGGSCWVTSDVNR